MTPRPALPSWVCPACGEALTSQGDDRLRCPADGLVFAQAAGIWRFLLPDRARHLAQFMRDYEHVRRDEGRGGQDAAYFRALPLRDLSGRHVGDWRIRARSYRALLDVVVTPQAARAGRPLDILDLGAGNGWLAARLAAAGHNVIAVDLQTNAFDGLGAHRHYEATFTPVQAEFDRLPVPGATIDLAIFNASFHYAEAYERVLRHVRRALRPAGRLVILDSPVYHDGRSGAQMVDEREAAFEQRYGFRGDALASENYLTHARLDALGDACGLTWQLHRPFYGWRWALRPWRARLRGHREPAKFMLIIGSLDDAKPAEMSVSAASDRAARPRSVDDTVAGRSDVYSRLDGGA